MFKELDWSLEDDDQDFGRESVCFLTGVRDGWRDGNNLPTLQPIRHDQNQVVMTNYKLTDDVCMLFDPWVGSREADFVVSSYLSSRITTMLFRSIRLVSRYLRGFLSSALVE